MNIAIIIIAIVVIIITKVWKKMKYSDLRKSTYFSY